MDATTIDELLTRDRRTDRPALVDATGREYDRHWLCTTAWKSGNFLRHAGVREGVTVGVDGEGPLAVLAFLGTALLEGRTQFRPPTDLSDRSSLQAIVAPVDRLADYELPRGTQRVGYGDSPERPDVHHFDAGLWSENPSFPPVQIEPETDLLVGRTGIYSHDDVLEAARDVIDEYGLEPGDRVAVRESLEDPRTVIAGVIAPLLAEGVIVLTGDVDVAIDGDESAETDVDDDSDTGSPEPSQETTWIDPSTVTIP